MASGRAPRSSRASRPVPAPAWERHSGPNSCSSCGRDADIVTPRSCSSNTSDSDNSASGSSASSCSAGRSYPLHCSACCRRELELQRSSHCQQCDCRLERDGCCHYRHPHGRRYRRHSPSSRCSQCVRARRLLLRERDQAQLSTSNSTRRRHKHHRRRNSRHRSCSPASISSPPASQNRKRIRVKAAITIQAWLRGHRGRQKAVDQAMLLEMELLACEMCYDHLVTQQLQIIVLASVDEVTEEFQSAASTAAGVRLLTLELLEETLPQACKDAVCCVIREQVREHMDRVYRSRRQNPLLAIVEDIVTEEARAIARTAAAATVRDATEAYLEEQKFIPIVDEYVGEEVNEIAARFLQASKVAASAAAIVEEVAAQEAQDIAAEFIGTTATAALLEEVAAQEAEAIATELVGDASGAGEAPEADDQDPSKVELLTQMHSSGAGAVAAEEKDGEEGPGEEELPPERDTPVPEDEQQERKDSVG